MSLVKDKNKPKDPKNTEENRELFVEIILNDMSSKEIREVVRSGILDRWRYSTKEFLKEYWDYYKETHGHCPFQINSD